ncbi:MAG: hypothetical protein WEB58_20615 [Planctomycetaceae bacterium]
MRTFWRYLALTAALVAICFFAPFAPSDGVTAPANRPAKNTPSEDFPLQGESTDDEQPVEPIGVIRLEREMVPEIVFFGMNFRLPYPEPKYFRMSSLVYDGLPYFFDVVQEDKKIYASGNVSYLEKGDKYRVRINFTEATKSEYFPDDDIRSFLTTIDVKPDERFGGHRPSFERTIRYGLFTYRVRVSEFLRVDRYDPQKIEALQKINFPQ